MAELQECASTEQGSHKSWRHKSLEVAKGDKKGTNPTCRTRCKQSSCSSSSLHVRRPLGSQRGLPARWLHWSKRPTHKPPHQHPGGVRSERPDQLSSWPEEQGGDCVPRAILAYRGPFLRQVRRHLSSCWPAEQLQTQLWGQTDSGSHLGFASCIVTLSSKSEVFWSVNMTHVEPFPRPDFSFELRKCSDCCHLHLHLPRHQLRKAGVVTPVSETRTRRLCGATSSESRISRLRGGAGCPSCHLDAPPRSPRALPRPSQPPPLPVPLRLAWSVSATGTGRVPGTLRSAVMRKVCGLQLTSVTPGKRESTVWQRPRGDLESKPGSVAPL